MPAPSGVLCIQNSREGAEGFVAEGMSTHLLFPPGDHSASGDSATTVIPVSGLASYDVFKGAAPCVIILICRCPLGCTGRRLVDG